MKKLFLLVLLATLTGCEIVPDFTVGRNNRNMTKLTVGMTKDQVLEVMGPAGKVEAYTTKSGGVIEFLMYRTLVDAASRFEVIQDRHWTPICIVDGKVEGWGQNFYDDTIKIRKEIIRRD